MQAAVRPPTRGPQSTTRERRRYVAVDSVVRALGAEDDDGIAHELRIAWAEEAASIAWQQRLCRSARALERLHSRRVDALYKLARFELDKHRLRGPDLDLRGARMDKLQALWMTHVLEAARAVLDPEAMEEFKQKCAVALEGWQDQMGGGEGGA